MKVALVVNRVTADIDANIESIVDIAYECADTGVDLIVYPEAAITGLINNDDSTHDLQLGQPIPGPVTNTLAKITQEHSIYLAIGVLERESNKLYDTAILLDPSGEIVLKYRRINPQWHGKQADPNVYCQGKELKKIKTALGTFMFLICGDLFEDNLVSQVRKLQPDWLLFPFSRCFADGTYDQARWDREEKPEYIKRVNLAETTTFIVNYIADKEIEGGSFGGAMVVLRTGKVIANLPIGMNGVLYVDL
ncbi:MAG: carbon-nitrogen hydrolase family protein [Candidatus Marinimicrobia bacterium]|nr:carbon-nitrogen hydrolase family protein [Candidatus Neomarinimicrobiota bacterium]